MPIFKVKDKWSTITHFIGFIFAIFMTPLIISKAAIDKIEPINIIAVSIFMLCMAILYGASSSYHAFNISEKINKMLKRLDHCSIFLLIAGSYTPVLIIGLNNSRSLILLKVVWILALCGIIFKIFWVTCPKWLSSIMYLALGWLVIFNIKDIYLSLTSIQFLYLVIGGIFYTIGGVLYSIKPKIFKKEELTGFGNHELFHVFIMLGTLSHFILVFKLI